MRPVSLHDSSRISETWKATTKQFFRCADMHASLELLYLTENINDAGPHLFADPLFLFDSGLADADQSWTHRQCRASSCSTFHGKACCRNQRTASLGNHGIRRDRPEKRGEYYTVFLANHIPLQNIDFNVTRTHKNNNILTEILNKAFVESCKRIHACSDGSFFIS